MEDKVSFDPDGVTKFDTMVWLATFQPEMSEQHPKYDITTKLVAEQLKWLEQNPAKLTPTQADASLVMTAEIAMRSLTIELGATFVQNLPERIFTTIIEGKEEMLDSKMIGYLWSNILFEVDGKLVEDLAQRAHSHTVSLDTRVTSFPTFIGDRFAVVPQKLRDVMSQSTEAGFEVWLLATPVMISILQTAASSTFKMAEKGSYEGYLGSSLCGNVDGKPIYTCISKPLDDGVLIGYTIDGQLHKTDLLRIDNMKDLWA